MGSALSLRLGVQEIVEPDCVCSFRFPCPLNDFVDCSHGGAPAEVKTSGETFCEFERIDRWRLLHLAIDFTHKSFAGAGCRGHNESNAASPEALWI